MTWYLTVLRKYFCFSGRARRKEYWMFQLFNVLVAMLIVVTGVISDASPKAIDDLLNIYLLLTFFPSMGVLVRRLHDIDRSGWWWLISCIPLIGAIILLIWVCKDGTQGRNRFGENPKYFDSV